MNSDRIAGAVKDVAGKVEESVGRLARDPETQARGVGRQLAGEAQTFHGWLGDVTAQRPLAALLIVGAAGCMLGLLARRR